MNIVEYINSETDINKLKEETLKHMRVLYKAMKQNEYKAYVFEFMLGNIDLSCNFEYVENPKVSIIIPVKNQFIITAYLLNSIKRNTQGIDYEVIIADDNSSDEIQYTEKIFKNIKRIVNNTGHSGFIYNVSNAIQNSSGEYIFLMNNDMIPLNGYLTELLNVIEKDETIGIAGSKTLSISMVVDECGAKMINNGDFAFIGQNEPIDFQDDNDYIDCDYCSGCSILFKRSVWDKTGGFDKNLEPAYYEDSDFAFNLKYNYGLKSVCVPKSKLFHFKGMSYFGNEDINNIVKRNKQYFLNKWKKYI